MAQELFISEETRERARKERLVNKGMRLWCDYAEEYRVLPYKYFFYLAEKKSAGMKLNKICATFCSEDNYPEIPFFRILDIGDALAWLKEKDSDELESLLGEIEFLLGSNYLYRSMREWVIEAIYLLSHDKPRPRSLAMGVSNSRHTRSRRCSPFVTAAE